MLKMTLFLKETLWHKACLYPHDRRRGMLNTSNDTQINLFVGSYFWLDCCPVLTKKGGHSSATVAPGVYSVR